MSDGLSRSGGTPSAEDGADVAIVGYGPVGSVLGILLAERGHRVVALERHPGPYAFPRAVHVDGPVARILQRCGIGDDLPDLCGPAGTYEWRNAAGQTLLRFLPRPDGGSGWPNSNMVHQPSLEAALERRAATLPTLDVRRGVEVTDLAQDATGVTLQTSAGPLRARYAVGCDGANSTVRSLLELEVRDLGFFYDWLICDVVPHVEAVWDPVNLQVCDPARPTTAVSGGPGRRRWEFMRLPEESAEELAREETAWRLLAPWGITPETATLERHTIYTFQARWVEQWRRGRVLVAGDAAHQMPPFAGQGMCSGIRDVANLEWKLDLVLRGLADDAVLDTYEVERKPDVAVMVEWSMALGSVICVPDAEAAARRDAGMIAALQSSGGASEQADRPGVVSGLVVADDPGAGRGVPQGVVADGRRFDDTVPHGWRLLLRGGAAPPVDPELAAWFAQLGGIVVTDPPAAVVTWLDDLARSDGDGGSEGDGLDGVLQRPDFAVFATVAHGASPDDTLARLRVALTT